MELEFSVLRKDYVALNKFVLFKMRIKKIFIIASFFIILWTVILNYDKAIDFISIFLETLFFYLIWAFVMFIVYQVTLFKIKKMPDNDGCILGNKKYIFDKNGIKETSLNSETITKWAGIKSFEENSYYFFIFVDKIAAYVIPKRVFSDKGEEIELRTILEQKIK